MNKYFGTVVAASLLLTGPLAHGEKNAAKLPPPTIVMKGKSKPLAPPKAATHDGVRSRPITGTADASTFVAAATATPSVNMKVLVLAGDASEISYQSITTYLDQIGVPFTAIAVDSLTPDGKGNYLTGVPLTDAATGNGLYQGIIYTNPDFSVCNPNCVNLLTTQDFATLSNYVSKYSIRSAAYYTYPEAQWGLSPLDNGQSYMAGSPLNVTLTTAGAAIFSYINKANAIPVSGSGTGGIYAFLASAVAAAGETTTPILMSGKNVVGVTHVNTLGQESMALTFDNYPTLLHSQAFSYGVINWVTRGIFLGQRQVYLSSQTDDILFGDRLYAPTLPQCPNDPSCPDIIGTGSDVAALANWQNTKHQNPSTPYIKTAFAFVGLGSAPGFAPIPDTVTPAMKTYANNFGWTNHLWTHGNLDCYTTDSSGNCIPATLDQSLFELEQNNVFAAGVPIPNDTTGMVTPFNGGLSNLAFFQAAAEEGVTSVISPNDPPSTGTGAPSIVPSILLIPRRVTNLFYDVDSPSTGVYGSLVDEYNAMYGPNGTSPTFATNQTYSQIMDNESTMLLQLRLLAYEPYPLGFHNSNAIAYDGTHSLLSDLFDATFAKYEKLYNIPIYSFGTMRDMAPPLLNRASYNASGVTGVYTPGVGVKLTTTNAAVIPVTGLCSQASCPTYGGQIQDRVAMAAGSSITLSTTAAAGVGLSTVTVNPGTVTMRSPSQGLVQLNGVATSAVVVTLSSNSSVATVPANVTVQPGDFGAAFTVAAANVTSPTSVNVSATYNGVSKSVPLTVTPAVALSGISLSASSTAAGTSPVATVTLTGAAPAGGITVSLISNNMAATVPAGVTVAAGSTTGAFNVSTLAVGAATTGNIVAVYDSVNLTTPLTVTPGAALALTSVTMTPAAVIGGGVSQGEVILNGLAPTGGFAVTLASNNAAAVVPGSVYVNAGSSTATFTATTSSVTATVNATISATYNGVTQTATLAVQGPGVSFLPSSVAGGTSSTGTIVLTSVAPAGGTLVTLASNNAAATVPANVTVAAGNTSATFTVNTSAVSASTAAKITAKYGSVTASGTLTVTPAVTLSSVAVNPASVTAGTASTGTVTLSGAAPTGGTVVALASNNAAATVPATVTVAAGSATGTFAIATTSVSASTAVTISATYSGTTKTATLTATPAATLSSVAVNPASVTAGTPSTGTVTLNQAAPTGGAAVTLWTNNGNVTVPATATVAAGSKTATFSVGTAGVFSAGNAIIGANAGGVTATATLSVATAALSGVALNPASLIAGSACTGTVTLSAAAPAGGTTVTLFTNNGDVTVPATVTVAAGSATATFALNTAAVFASGNTLVSANSGGVTASSTLAVTAAALSGVAVNPASVTGGTATTGTVTLSAAAPAGGLVVTLFTNNAGVKVPATVTVAAGSATATFGVTTSPVSASTNVAVSANFGGATASSTLTLN